jgi:hypothetical protein
MVRADLDISRSEAVSSVLELLPMTAVLRTSWHECGTGTGICCGCSLTAPELTEGHRNLRLRHAQRAGINGAAD